MSGSGLIPYAVEPRRSAETERADVLALLDEKIRACRKNDATDSARRFEAMREEIVGGLHERSEG